MSGQTIKAYVIKHKEKQFDLWLMINSMDYQRKGAIANFSKWIGEDWEQAKKMGYECVKVNLTIDKI